MAQVPSNLIPVRVSQLQDAPVASEDGLLLYVYNGNTYKIRAGDLLNVAGVPTTRQVIAGTALTGGGPLATDVTLSVAPGGIGTSQLAASGVTPGTYGSSTTVPVVTLDATGRVMSATTAAVAVSGYVPETRQVIAGTGLSGGGTLNNDVTLIANLSNATPVSGYQTGSSGAATGIARSDHKHPAVDLADDNEVDGLLGLSNGGTARSLVAAAGAAVWSGADGLYVGPVGAAGQVLVSGGASAPTWGSAIILSDEPANVVYAGPTAGPAAPVSFRALVAADLPVGTGTVTSVAALTLGTTGTDLSSTVATGTTTPVITLNVPTASATNRGALSTTDWSTFNGKQPAGSYLTAVTADTPIVGSGTPASHLSIPASSGSISGYLSSTDWSTFNGKQDTFGSQTANYVYAAPNGSAGVPGFRALVAADIPSLSATYIPYTGASSAVDLNDKSLVNVSHLGIGTAVVPTILSRFVGDNGANSRSAIRGYSSDANSSSWRLTKFRGAVATPQVPQSGDSLGKFEFAGYTTTSSDGLPSATLEAVTTETWGATARGTKVQLKVTANTTTTQVVAMTIDQDKSVTLPGALSVTGHTTFEGVTSTGATGTGKIVYDTSPTLATPLLGTPTSGNFSTGTFTWPTFNQNTTGSAATLTTSRSIAGVSFNGSADVDIPLDNLSDVTIASPVVDEILKYNGANWVNGAASSISAGYGIEYFNATPQITAAGTNNAIAIFTLSAAPITTTEQTTTSTSIVGTTVSTSWLSTALGRTAIDAGSWDYTVFAGVNTAGGATITLSRQMYAALPFVTGTVTTTGTGTTRTATASAGTPFATSAITASGTVTLASYLQTPQGLYQISARTSDTVVTIVTLSTYANESAVAGTVWKLLFATGQTPNLTTTITQYDILTVQPAFTITTATKLGAITFITGTNAGRIVTTTFNGTARNTHMASPLAILHNQLGGLQGGTSNEQYHLTDAEYIGTGTEAFVRLNSPTLTSPVTVKFENVNATATLSIENPLASSFFGSQLALMAGASTYRSSFSQLGSTGVASLMNLSNAALSLGTNSTERMRITSTGNVGIGTTAPASLLNIVSGANQSSYLTIGQSGQSSWQIGEFQGENSFRISDDGTPFLIEAGAPSNTFYIKGNGNVGIGTATPGYKLEVNGTLSAGAGITNTAGRSSFAATSEPYAIAAKYSNAAAGAVFFGATDATTTPGFQISNASGTSLLSGTTAGAVTIPGTLGVTGQISGSAAVASAGALTTTVASTTNMDYTSGGGRQIVRGPDASTNGTFKVVTTRSDGTNALTPLSIDTAGAVTIPGTLSVTQGITVGIGGQAYVAGVLGYTDANNGFVYRPPRAGGTKAHSLQSYAGGYLLDITESGEVSVKTATSTLGYGTGSGGTVTQASTSGKSTTTPACDHGTGQITTDNASLSNNTTVFFNVPNSVVTAKDTIVLSFGGFTGNGYNYQCWAFAIAAGSFYIALRNVHGSTALGESVVINFTVIKGA